MPRPLRLLAFVTLCALGALAGALAAGRLRADVGPFLTSLSLRPTLTGDAVVRLAPLGSLWLDTHDGLFGLTLSADELDLGVARRIVEDPRALDALDDAAVVDARRAVRSLGMRAGAGALAGALAVALLRRPSRRSLALGAATAVVTAGLVAGVARLTWNDDALAQPRYTGLLTVAPQAIGSIERVQEQYDEYRAQLASLVGNIAQLYNTTAGLTSYAPDSDTIRVLHVSDIHLNPQAFDLMAQLVQQFKVDIVVDTGDITDWGTVLEARLVERIGSLAVPYVYVRGNHDSAVTAAAIAAVPNAVVLDGSVREVAGLRFWGVGDPRFTPDKTEEVDVAEERAIADRFAPDVARRLRRAEAVDIVAVHDPRVAQDLGGLVPLVLAGHLHKPGERRLGEGTRLLLEGSTGGAGLRALEQGEPARLTCSVLYFDRPERTLRAFDRVTVSGLGDAGARIERHVVPRRPQAGTGGPAGGQAR